MFASNPNLKDQFWPLSKALLLNILDDRINDRFVAKLVWERLGYCPITSKPDSWVPGPNTPIGWSKAFPFAPEVIAQRRASVKLTQSIPKEYKQLLKQNLDFAGYKIGELYPRRTRRATVVNWLLAWVAMYGKELPENGTMPTLSDPPKDPTRGHLGDPDIE